MIFVRFDPVRIFVFIIFLVPTAVFSQTDFNTRYFTITSESLPEIQDISTFKLYTAPFVKRSIKDFQMNADNYRQTVDMTSVVNEDFVNSPQNVDLKTIQSQYFSFGNTPAYVSDGSTKVKNTVYKEMRGLTFLDACPPFGICPRCAPYRVGRGY